MCAECDLSYAELTIDEALDKVRRLPGAVHAAALGVPPELRVRRPEPRTWSVVEYACHIRDVYAAYTVRLYRTRTEERPAVEPLLPDRRVEWFRYNSLDLTAVLHEIESNVDGFVDEVGQATDWDRVATRLPHEVRTARWLVRQATHEGIHHVHDITAVGRAVQATG